MKCPHTIGPPQAPLSSLYSRDEGTAVVLFLCPTCWERARATEPLKPNEVAPRGHGINYLHGRRTLHVYGTPYTQWWVCMLTVCLIWLGWGWGGGRKNLTQKLVQSTQAVHQNWPERPTLASPFKLSCWWLYTWLHFSCFLPLSFLFLLFLHPLSLLLSLYTRRLSHSPCLSLAFFISL